jgi:REP element-mobilizing transposase RayT
MAYTQILIHFVFSVKNRESVLKKDWRDRLYKYMIAIIQSGKHKALSIGGTDDHVHILVGFHPTQTIASLMLELKRDSSKWVNENNFLDKKFAWQSSYGAFSYSKSQIEQVVQYIHNQEEHHKTVSFEEEFKILLDKYEIEYNKKYLHD